MPLVSPVASVRPSGLMATELTCSVPAPGSGKERTIGWTAAGPGLSGRPVPRLEEPLDVGLADRTAAGLDEWGAAPRPEILLGLWPLAPATIMAAITPPAVTMATA